jgi:putative holliday junction resolvase
MYHRRVRDFDARNRATSDRILAIDFGLARIGLAVSDALALTAQGLATLERTNREADLGRIAGLVAEYSVARVIVGYPISSSGGETEMSRRVVRFADELRARLACPVELWDERGTSLEADRMLRETGARRTARRRTRDRVAATILLQSYLDRRAQERERQGVQAVS